MAGRPEALFPLFCELDALPGVGAKLREKFERVHITRPRDLLFQVPTGYVDRTPIESVQGQTFPTTVTLEVTIQSHVPPRARGRPYRVIVEDERTSFQLLFFHANGDYLARILPVGERKIISGKAEMFGGIVQIVHPEHIADPKDAAEVPRLEPVYRLTAGVSQKIMAKAVNAALKRAPAMAEWIEPSLLKAEGWPTFDAALGAVHHPTSLEQVAPDAPALRRLAYDELLAHQLTLALARRHLSKGVGRSTLGDGRLRQRALDALPYAPTAAQIRVGAEIADDMAQATRMHRLLQGDVGSGKTLVAFLALLTAVEAGGQGVMMAPTEILARQHHESLTPLARAVDIRLECLTGRDKGAARQGKLEALKRGEIDILVGTHAVFQDDVAFCDLRLAIVDEQHRFGVRQRLSLGQRGTNLDMLVMTATPIPRSLSLAQYGDMDISVLDVKPPGRKPVTTALSSDEKLQEIVDHLRSAVAQGRQAYWVCPLVEESELSDRIAAEERFKHLRAALKGIEIGLVHGQMPSDQKDAAMARFVAGDVAVLVATTVIEVGVDVPNASIMVVERAETFGLSQLHQLRGRVGRGSEASTCLLLYRAPLSQSGKRRLEIMRETEDGFRIAEEDLTMRGAGDVIGTAQSGLPRFMVADLERGVGLLTKAHADARLLLDQDPELVSPRGQAARTLLWLMDQDQAFSLIKVG